MLTAARAEGAMGEPGPVVAGGCAQTRTWCLRRVGMDAEWLLLEDGGEVRAGEGLGGGKGSGGKELLRALCRLWGRWEVPGTAWRKAGFAMQAWGPGVQGRGGRGELWVWGFGCMEGARWRGPEADLP